MLSSFCLPPLEFCFGTSPIQAEKSRPDRKTFGSATLATRAVASAGPTPGSSSSRLLTWLERCQAMIRPSNSNIRALSICNWAPSATIQTRATSGSRLSLPSLATLSSSSTPCAPDRGDYRELSKVSSDRIDDCRLLTNEQMACAMEHQAALLLDRLRRNEPHACPRHRFADCLRIGTIEIGRASC